jgi:hypothetical protein
VYLCIDLFKESIIEPEEDVTAPMSLLATRWDLGNRPLIDLPDAFHTLLSRPLEITVTQGCLFKADVVEPCVVVT